MVPGGGGGVGLGLGLGLGLVSQGWLVGVKARLGLDDYKGRGWGKG